MEKRKTVTSVRMNDQMREKLNALSDKLTRGNNTACIEMSLKLLSNMQTLADKHAKGSLEVLLFMIEEKFKG